MAVFIRIRVNYTHNRTKLQMYMEMVIGSKLKPCHFKNLQFLDNDACIAYALVRDTLIVM